MASYVLRDFVGFTVEGAVEGERHVTIKALGESVEIADGHPPLPAAGATVGITLTLSPAKTKVVCRVVDLPAKRVTTGKKLVLAAVLSKFVQLPLNRAQASPLSAAPFAFYQVPEASFEIFMRTTSNGVKRVDMPLKGYRVAQVKLEDGKQFGLVDLKTSEITNDGRDIVGSGIAYDNGEPGTLLSVESSVFDALPVRADVYIVPDDNERLYFGTVDRERDQTTVYGSLLIATAARRIEHAAKTGNRLLLEPCTTQHDSFLAGVICSRVALDRVERRVGAKTAVGSVRGWEVLNDPQLISQLCFSQSMSTMMSRLDRGDHPSFGSFINLSVSASSSPVPVPPAKRQKTESPPPAASRSRTPPPAAAAATRKPAGVPAATFKPVA